MIVLKCFLILFCLSMPLQALGWEGMVISVADGDLMTVMHDGREEKVRLFGVDTPDEPQDFGLEAREFTSNLVLGKMVEVTPVSVDRHGNTVAIVSVRGVSLNRELAGSGFAWVYSSRNCNLPECREWKAIEYEARKRQVGLWSAANPTPPWDFRHSGGNAVPVLGGEKIDSLIDSPGEEQREGAVLYYGDIVNRIYHAPECPEYRCKNCIADFKGKRKAERAGYKPCPVCNP